MRPEPKTGRAFVNICVRFSPAYIGFRGAGWAQEPRRIVPPLPAVLLYPLTVIASSAFASAQASGSRLRTSMRLVFPESRQAISAPHPAIHRPSYTMVGNVRFERTTQSPKLRMMPDFTNPR